MPEELYRLLAWDTAAFGFQTARILPDQLDSETLAQTLAMLRQEGVVLAYWMVQDPAVSALALAAGGVLVDKKSTYVVSVGETPRGRPPNVTEYEGPADHPDLLALAVESGQYSRFYVDPRFPRPAFVRLYQEWIINSVRHTIADVVWVTRRNSQITGMITAGEKNGRVDIGLIAVAKEARGEGLASALVGTANAWGAERGYTVGQVVTQADNLPACRLYERCGYVQEKREDVFHFWLGA